MSNAVKGWTEQHWATWKQALRDAHWTAYVESRRYRVFKAEDGCWVSDVVK